MEGADLIKLLVELPLAGVVIYAIRELKPVLEKHFEQQRAQFGEMTKLVAEVVAGQKTLSEGQEALKQALLGMGLRLDRVEVKVEELVEATDAHHT
jgi:hypothetical protein